MDHLGSTRVVMDNNGITQEYDYDPFGRQVVVTGATTGGPVRESFIGKEKDSEDNLGDFGVRKYDENLGRFMSTDALWEKYRFLNPYQYCADNPVCLTDRSGDSIQVMGKTKAETSQILAELGIVVGGTFTYKILPNQAVMYGMEKYYVAIVTGFARSTAFTNMKQEQDRTIIMMKNKQTMVRLMFVPDAMTKECGGTQTDLGGISSDLHKVANIEIGDYYKTQTIHNRFVYEDADGNKNFHDIYSSLAHEFLGHAWDHTMGYTDDLLKSWNTSNHETCNDAEEQRAMVPENKMLERLGKPRRAKY